MDKRVSDRRISKKDFRKYKKNQRVKYRRKVDKINHSIYYMILLVLFLIILLWGLTDFYFYYLEIAK